MAQRTELAVSIGDKAMPVGRVTHFQDATRVFTQFAYASSWLNSPQAFAVSPELALLPGTQIRKPKSGTDSCFFHALADTAAGDWSSQIVARAHDNARETTRDLPPLTEVDALLAVNDTYRLGALRLTTPLPWWAELTRPSPLATVEDLPRALAACWALEKRGGFSSDLAFLMAHGTSLGGSRPKVSLMDTDGSLALAKFPRLQETHNLPLGEILALKMARLAGINTVEARIEYVNGIPVAVVQRFDRRTQGGRKLYISAASLLQANSQDKLTYLELLDAMRRVSSDFVVDAQQLWRRLVFNLLITNTDDHLRNTGFLYEGRHRWRLAPAFDLNPFPDSPRSSSTALSARAGAVTDVSMLLEHASFFEMSVLQAKTALAEVASIVSDWHRIARSAGLRLPKDEVAWYGPAFEHDQLYTALRASV